MAQERIDIQILIDDAKASKSLGELRQNLAKLEDAAEKIGDKSSADFKKLDDSIKSTKKQLLEEAVAAAKAAKSMREMQMALRDLKTLQEQVDDSQPEFDTLINQINETEGRIGDLNDSFKTFAGSGVERATASTNLLREGFTNLDPEKISIGFKGLGKSIQGFTTSLNKTNPFVVGLGKSMTNLKGGFQGFAKSGIGSVIQALAQLGKAILTNPILLLAAVVIAIVAAMVKFYDKIKPLRMVVEALGKAIDVVVQALKDFADWLGISDFEGEKMAENQIKRNKKLEENITKRYDREIAVASAAGGKTEELELKKIQAVKKSVMEQIQAYYKLAQINGELTDEQKTALEELKNELYDLETEYQVTKAKIKKDNADKLKENKKKVEENAKKVQESRKKAAQDAAKTAEEERKARAEADKALRKQIEDDQAELIKDEEERDLRKLYLQNKRAAEDIQNSKASAEQKAAALNSLTQKYEADRLVIIDKYDKERTDKNKEKKEKEKEAAQQKADDLAAATKTAQELEIYELKKTLDEKLLLYANDAELQKALKEKFELDKKAIDDKYKKEKEDADKEAAEKEIAALQAVEEQKAAIQQQGLDLALQGVGLIKGVFEKQKGVQKAAVIAESAIGIAKMVISNKLANIGALATPQAIATSGAAAAPVIAMNNISTALGIAANIAATAKALKELGGGSAPAAPSLGGGGGGAGTTSQQAGNFTPSQFYSLGGGSQNNQNTNNQQSVVYVGDINKVQNKVQVIENRAVLGQ